jgi:L-threonylcarbamoyladenylate synthase
MRETVSVEEAAAWLRQGKIVCYPTETAYALGVDATNAAAVEELFAVKGRPEGKGVPVILPPHANPADFVHVADKYKELAAVYWPGALNIVAPRLPNCTIVTACATGTTQSLRKSAHPVAAALAEALGRPITATSANRSGEPTIYAAVDIWAAFGRESNIAAFLSVGDLAPLPPSTTVEITPEGELIIHRQGAVMIAI